MPQREADAYTCGRLRSFWPSSSRSSATLTRGGWTGAFCFYDALGRALTTCEQPGTSVGYAGPNIVRTGSDNQPTAWTFIHGPGVDDPLLAYRPSGAYTYFFVTDGQGRQVPVGKANGESADLTIGGAKASGSVPGGTTFEPKRLESPAMPTISFFRNRWYDAETQRWTQEDPLGVAGGMNLYQYVGGNPVAWTDPFGLVVEFADDRARQIYEQLRRSAKDAARSRNRDIARAGRELTKRLNALEADADTVVITVNEQGENGFGQVKGTSKWGIVINPASPSDYSPQVRLAHELGHAYSAMVDGFDPGNPSFDGRSNDSALGFENNMRSIWGCWPRIAHNTWSARFNPRCD